MADLGVTKIHSRPHVSDDNPYSESQFKTMKYHTTFPEKFGSLEDGRKFERCFFLWYNAEHRHSSLGLMTPSDIHHGLAEAKRTLRREVLEDAFAASNTNGSVDQ